MCDSVNHTRFPKEDHLPDSARRDNEVTKGYRVEIMVVIHFAREKQHHLVNMPCLKAPRKSGIMTSR